MSLKLYLSVPPENHIQQKRGDVAGKCKLRFISIFNRKVQMQEKETICGKVPTVLPFLDVKTLD